MSCGVCKALDCAGASEGLSKCILAYTFHGKHDGIANIFLNLTVSCEWNRTLLIGKIEHCYAYCPEFQTVKIVIALVIPYNDFGASPSDVNEKCLSFEMHAA